MPLVVTLCAVFFSNLYLKDVSADFLKEGALAGSLWMSICLALDLCMFMKGPMQMTFAAYMKDIGLGYLIFPTITAGAGWLLRRNLASRSHGEEPHGGANEQIQADA